MNLTKEQYDALPAFLKKMYVKDGDGYKPVDSNPYGDAEDVGGLKSALQKERDAAKSLRDDLTSLRTELDEIKKAEEKKADQDAAKKGDVEALEKSWKAKLEKREAELQATIQSRENSLRKILVDAEAQKLASEISTAPDLLVPHLAARMQAEFDGEDAVTRILDANGQKSAASIDDFKKEVLSDKRFSSILIGSKGSGGGAGGPGAAGAGGAGLKEFKREDGTTDWEKVHQASKDNPELLTEIKANLGQSSASTD